MNISEVPYLLSGQSDREDSHVFLIERESQMALLSASLDAASHGRRGIVVIEGEAGIGKSALLGETLAGQHEPYHLFHGVADRLGSGLPFGLLANALHLASDSADGPFGEVAEAMFGSPTETATSAFRITELTLNILERLAEEKVVLLAMEDLQWSDAATLSFIERCFRRSEFVRMCLLLTARPDPRSPELSLLMDSLRDADAKMVALKPLSEEGVIATARNLINAAPGPSLTAQLKRTGGNPLFVRELVTALEESGRLHESRGVMETSTATLPDSLRKTILGRLNTLGERVVSILTHAAVFGRRFSVPDVMALGKHELADALEDIASARRAGLIRDEGDLIAFRHDVIREALYDQLPASAKRALHSAASVVLSARGADVTEVAEHVVRGIRPGDTEAVAHLRVAATRLAAPAPTEAIRLLDAAIDAVPDHPERTAMEAELAELCMWTGRPKRAEELARRALTTPGVASKAAIALIRAVVQQNDPDHTVATIEALLERGVDGSEARLQAEAAQGLSTSEHDHERARDLALRALHSHDRPDPTAIMLAEVTLGYLANYHGHLDEARQHTDRALEVARQDPTGESLKRAPHLAHGFHLNLSGRLSEAEEVLAAGLAEAERLGTAWAIPGYHALAGVIYGALGRWEDAESELVAGIQLGKELGVTVQLVNMYMFLGELLVERGRLHEAQVLLADAGQDLPLEEGARLPSPFARWGGARWIDEAEGRFENVAARAVATIELIERMGYVFVYRPVGLDLVRALVRVGRDSDAKFVVERLEWLMQRGAPSWFRGDVACAGGLVKRDIEALLQAVVHYRESGWVFRLATGLVDAAAATSADDPSSAMTMLGEAAHIFERLGAVRRTAMCEAALRKLGVRRGVRGTRNRPVAGWAALTEREVSVAQLISEGLSNPEIGERLFISRRTVEVHVAHIFQKLALSSRTRLAAEVAARRGRAEA